MESNGRQKVLITGGAGFLGYKPDTSPHGEGYALASLDVEEFDYPEGHKIETIKGDIRDKALLDRAMEGVDFVVHTAAALPLYTPEDIYTTDVEGTRNVLDAARRHGIGRVVHVSSTAVYGIPDHHPCTRRTSWRAWGRTGRRRYRPR
jgi:nucleoside-diphosphate-sugar epimerase